MIVNPLTVIHLISSYNVRFLNNSPAVVVLIGRLMCKVMRIAPSCLMYKMYIHIRKTAWSSCSSWPVDRPESSCHLLFPWCMAITGYHTSSINCNNHWQPMAGYRQTTKLLPGKSQQWWVKTTTKQIYVWQFEYANTIPTVLCMKNG